MPLYDFIYVDLDKVISLYSQLTGGVVELREADTQQLRTADNKRRYDFKIFQHDAGGTKEDVSGLKEVVKPHHSLLIDLEAELARSGQLADLTAAQTSLSLRDDDFRKTLKNTLCLKVRGRAVVEDYERIKGIADVFPQIVALINRSAEANLRESEEFVELQQTIERMEQESRQIKDRNKRAKARGQAKALKESLEEKLGSASKVEAVDQWVLDGLRTWVDAFLPGIVNLRVYPSEERPDEHVFGHLKKACFEDSDSNSFHFTYGSLPTESLTVVGIITSVPSHADDTFSPLAEFTKEVLEDYESVEKAFRGVFRGFDGFEQMIRTCRFPRVLVHPLTVYRSVQPE